MAEQEVAAATGEQTWTFVGHWEGDEIVVETYERGEVQDYREDDGEWPEGLWAASGSGTDMLAVEREVTQFYEHEHHYDAVESCDICATDGPKGWGV